MDQKRDTTNGNDDSFVCHRGRPTYLLACLDDYAYDEAASHFAMEKRTPADTVCCRFLLHREADRGQLDRHVLRREKVESRLNTSIRHTLYFVIATR